MDKGARERVFAKTQRTIQVAHVIGVGSVG